MLKKIFQLIGGHPIKTSVASFASAVLFLIAWKQNSMIYIPNIGGGTGKRPSQNPFPYRDPAEFNFDSYENIEIKTADELTLRGWYIPSDSPKQLVLYFHENAGNIGLRLPYIKNIINRTQSDVMIIAYRGYSDSEGSPSERGLKFDAQAILVRAIIEAQKRKLPLIVLGRSLGGGAAIYACKKHQDKVAGLILENTFTSITDVGLNFCPGVLKPLAHVFLFLFLRNKWNSISLIPEIKIPILFIKSKKDELIPQSQMDRLQEKCETRNEAFQIENGTHNETWGLNPQEYFARWRRFINQLNRYERL